MKKLISQLVNLICNSKEDKMEKSTYNQKSAIKNQSFHPHRIARGDSDNQYSGQYVITGLEQGARHGKIDLLCE